MREMLIRRIALHALALRELRGSFHLVYEKYSSKGYINLSRFFPGFFISGRRCVRSTAPKRDRPALRGRSNGRRHYIATIGDHFVVNSPSPFAESPRVSRRTLNPGYACCQPDSTCTGSPITPHILPGDCDIAFAVQLVVSSTHPVRRYSQAQRVIEPSTRRY